MVLEGGCKHLLLCTLGTNKEELRPQQAPASQELEAEGAGKGQRRHGIR